MVLVDAAAIATATATANANANPKVQDEKKPSEWSLRGLWYGPCRRMPYEFAEVRKMYPNIPAENADLFAGQGLLNKVGRALSFNTCSVVVKTDYKGREVVKRTMLVSGRDVGKLEADVEKLNKYEYQSVASQGRLKDILHAGPAEIAFRLHGRTEEQSNVQCPASSARPVIDLTKAQVLRLSLLVKSRHDRSAVAHLSQRKNPLNIFAPSLRRGVEHNHTLTSGRSSTLYKLALLLKHANSTRVAEMGQTSH